MIHARPPEIPQAIRKANVFKGDLYTLAQVLTAEDIRHAIDKRKAETEARQEAIWNDDNAFAGEIDE